MPKNFPFYNPDEHKHLISLLEQSPPRAIISTTKQPLFVDGDFDIPLVYMPDDESDRLRYHVGEPVELISKARRIPATAFNIVAGNGDTAKKRIVLYAHIDTAIGTTGALDNATGVATSQWILDESDWQEAMHTQLDNLDKVAPAKVLEYLLVVALISALK